MAGEKVALKAARKVRKVQKTKRRFKVSGGTRKKLEKGVEGLRKEARFQAITATITPNLSKEGLEDLCQKINYPQSPTTTKIFDPLVDVGEGQQANRVFAGVSDPSLPRRGRIGKDTRRFLSISGKDALDQEVRQNFIIAIDRYEEIVFEKDEDGENEEYIPSITVIYFNPFTTIGPANPNGKEPIAVIDMPDSKYQSFLNAPSKGKWYLDNIAEGKVGSWGNYQKALQGLMDLYTEMLGENEELCQFSLADYLETVLRKTDQNINLFNNPSLLFKRFSQYVLSYANKRLKLGLGTTAISAMAMWSTGRFSATNFRQFKGIISELISKKIVKRTAELRAISPQVVGIGEYNRLSKNIAKMRKFKKVWDFLEFGVAKRMVSQGSRGVRDYFRRKLTAKTKKRGIKITSRITKKKTSTIRRKRATVRRSGRLGRAVGKTIRR